MQAHLTGLADQPAPKRRPSPPVCPAIPTPPPPEPGTDCPSAAPAGEGGGFSASCAPLANRPLLCTSLRQRVSAPVLFFWNPGNNHWNLVRVQTAPRPVIEVFEPFGTPSSRGSGRGGGGLSKRGVPPGLVTWLDAVCPVAGGWQSRSLPAIPHRHQHTGFDCGVACLLYAEKAAQGMQRHDIAAGTDQREISRFRDVMRKYFERLRTSTPR
ncbi:hypothetical protein FNF27_05796 [Cafeteria roenbergensis]|uniref:Ubiquitin-like protease family profile domain-containing protein n=1 Tax=Cafeteria roenbergensis TaxID=33653 RepID=A0A5A8E4P5_CAFRO|nr:hypothetical protein FNF27_05796 [Cafeteria roenbergensis]